MPARWRSVVSNITGSARRMSISFRAVSFVVLLGACAQAALAQDAAVPRYSPKQVPALLESGDPREQAWGAWLAGRFFLTDSVPLLERAVETRLNSSQGWDAALDISLDALIQLNAQLPPALLERIHERKPEQALILMSRQAQRLTSFCAPFWTRRLANNGSRRPISCTNAERPDSRRSCCAISYSRHALEASAAAGPLQDARAAAPA